MKNEKDKAWDFVKSFSQNPDAWTIEDWKDFYDGITEAFMKIAKRHKKEAPKLEPCPHCYGGHFRPCQTCGDSGLVEIVPDVGNTERWRMKSKSAINRNMQELSALCDYGSPIEARIAQAMRHTLQWSKGSTEGWPSLTHEAKELARIVEMQLRNK